MRRLIKVLITLTLLSTALAVNTNSTSSQQSESPLKCQTERAPDYYGLGVRLGIYFSWLSAWVANTMLPSEIPGALDQNSIFLFAIIVSMIRCSVTDMLEQIDGLMLMHLAAGTIFGISSLWGYRTCQYVREGPGAIKHYGGFGTHARLLLALSISAYGLWFWMFGVKGSLSPMGPGDEPPNAEACGELFTFMFAKVQADGGIRIFYIFICMTCVVVYGIMALSSTLAGFSRGQKIIELWKKRQFANSTRLRFATGFKYSELRFLSSFWKWWSLIWLIFSAMLAEFTLNFNHIQAVLGGPNDNELHLPAQLLPLLIGAFSFLRILWLTVTAYREPGDANPSIVDEDHMVHKARTLRMGLSYLQLFSPALAVDARKEAPYHPDTMDPLQKRRSTVVRYFIGVMPWFSLLKVFRNQDDDNEADVGKKRLGQYTNIP